MRRQNQDIALFVSFCIEQYGRAKAISTDEVVVLFDRYHVVEYLCDCYESLHTQGHRWLIEEIDEYINKRKQ